MNGKDDFAVRRASPWDASRKPIAGVLGGAGGALHATKAVAVGSNSVRKISYLWSDIGDLRAVA